MYTSGGKLRLRHFLFSVLILVSGISNDIPVTTGASYQDRVVVTPKRLIVQEGGRATDGGEGGGGGGGGGGGAGGGGAGSMKCHIPLSTPWKEIEWIRPTGLGVVTCFNHMGPHPPCVSAVNGYSATVRMVFTDDERVESYLRINNVSRADEGLWRCRVQERLDPKPKTGTSQLRVFKQAQELQCGYQLNANGAEVKCKAMEIYPGAICRWRINGVETNVPYKTQNSPYDGDNGYTYYSSTCSIHLSKKTFRFKAGPLNVSVSMDYGPSSDNILAKGVSQTQVIAIEEPRSPKYKLLRGKRIRSIFYFVPGDEVDLICYVYHGKPHVESVTLSCQFPVSRDGDFTETWRGVSLVLNKTATKDMAGKTCSCHGNHLTGSTDPEIITFKGRTPTAQSTPETTTTGVVGTPTTTTTTTTTTQSTTPTIKNVIPSSSNSSMTTTTTREAKSVLVSTSPLSTISSIKITQSSTKTTTLLTSTILLRNLTRTPKADVVISTSIDDIVKGSQVTRKLNNDILDNHKSREATNNRNSTDWFYKSSKDNATNISDSNIYNKAEDSTYNDNDNNNNNNYSNNGQGDMISKEDGCQDPTQGCKNSETSTFMMCNGLKCDSDMMKSQQQDTTDEGGSGIKMTWIGLAVAISITVIIIIIIIIIVYKKKKKKKSLSTDENSLGYRVESMDKAKDQHQQEDKELEQIEYQQTGGGSMVDIDL